MYLLARVIKSMGIKMVLSGEGADEVFGGYLYFHKAPTPQAFHEETVRKLSKLHLYDCLRANKSLAAWGVEGRVPFLDKEFLDVAMRINPAVKMCPGKEIEKKVVREAFADILPQSVAWRQKEQFSDGVGYSWIDTLKAVTAAAVSDEQMAHAAERFPIHTPQNKEEYYYRTIFEEHFPSESAARSVPSVPSVACSTAEALAWDASFQGKNDPSGRAGSGGTRRSIQRIKKRAADRFPASSSSHFLFIKSYRTKTSLSVRQSHLPQHSLRHISSNHIPRFLHKDYPLSD